MSLMEDSWTPVMYWAVFVCWRTFWSDTVQLLYHAVMQFVRCFQCFSWRSSTESERDKWAFLNFLLHLFDQDGDVEGPGKVFRIMDTQELEAGNVLHLHLFWLWCLFCWSDQLRLGFPCWSRLVNVDLLYCTTSHANTMVFLMMLID